MFNDELKEAEKAVDGLLAKAKALLASNWRGLIAGLILGGLLGTGANVTECVDDVASVEISE